MAITQPPTPLRRSKPQQTPQETIDDFWARFTTRSPGKATTIVPQNRYAGRVAKNSARAGLSSSSSTTTIAAYHEARAMCSFKVEKITRECRRINKKYRDAHFDLESDLKLGRRDCLQPLSNLAEKDAPVLGSSLKPQSAKRVVDVFDKPRFFIDGPTANDVRQGRDGDCWLMAALCTLSNKEGLIEKLCVAHDQDVGVYGFVFYRDGEWISEIVDDFLYLTKPDYDEGYLERILLNELERVNPEEAYRRIYQSNSTSLYFAQCQHPQETWLPLLEKAYAKAHGDYASIEGGFGGEGIEDLTGGVASELFTTDILDKEYFWKKELLKVNDEFLFSCSTGVWGALWGERRGIVELHAYSIQKAVEIDGKRLVRLKNPWGKGEWKGAWSDGSKEWTPEWLEKLGHRFSDDGLFWMEYEDLLRKYQAFERTRLFDENWRVAQLWTTLAVPWTVDYHDTYFSFTISKPGPVVIVFAQLDDRYFRGLQGQYRFELGFRVHKAGHEDYLVRSQAPYRMRRSINVELDLEEGEYEVRVKVAAVRLDRFLPIEAVVRNNAKTHREKLTRIGLAYDLAHGKGQVAETEDEKTIREAHEKKVEEKERRDTMKKVLDERDEAHYLATKKFRQDQKRRLREETKRRATRKDKTSGENAPETISGQDNLNGSHAESENHDVLSDPDSLSELSDRELEIQIKSYNRQPKKVDGADTTPATEPRELEEFEKDPWNAVAVVGLRVYYKATGQGDDEEIVKLKVVRPSLYIDGEDGEVKVDETETRSRGLDVDDSSKDATLEGGVKDRKKSIMGDGLRLL